MPSARFDSAAGATDTLEAPLHAPIIMAAAVIAAAIRELITGFLPSKLSSEVPLFSCSSAFRIICPPRHHSKGTATMTPISPPDTAWMLVATAMVLLMTPALGFFYGGMVRAQNTLNTMMMSFVALDFVGLAWALVGYSLAFAGSNRVIGTLGYALLAHVDTAPHGTIPHLLFMAYQGAFAVITAALISGAIVE